MYVEVGVCFRVGLEMLFSCINAGGCVVFGKSWLGGDWNLSMDSKACADAKKKKKKCYIMRGLFCH